MRLTEYSLRMNKVLDHIDRHLAEPLDLDSLADVAHFSRYHFHRVFSSWIGETLGDYLRRRRLEIAALRLVSETEMSVLEIAVGVGFGSGEAFARAFKARFGCTPTEWRKEAPRRRDEAVAAVRQRRKESNADQAGRNIDQMLAQGGEHNGGSFYFLKEPTVQVKIVEFPSVKVAYMRHIGPYGPKVSEFWRTSFAPWLAANGLLGAPCYGIGHDDPSITPADKCRYDACVEVSKDFVPTGKVSLTTLPGGRYAVTRFEGKPESVADTWIELFRDWLPRSGFRCDGRPCFEYYPRDWKPAAASGLFALDICVPVTAA